MANIAISKNDRSYVHLTKRSDGCDSRLAASVLLLEGRWFDSPWSACRSVLGQDTESILLLMGWSAPCMAATAVSVWITVSWFEQKYLINTLNVRYVGLVDDVIIVTGLE